MAELSKTDLFVGGQIRRKEEGFSQTRRVDGATMVKKKKWDPRRGDR